MALAKTTSSSARVCTTARLTRMRRSPQRLARHPRQLQLLRPPRLRHLLQELLLRQGRARIRDRDRSPAAVIWSGATAERAERDGRPGGPSLPFCGQLILIGESLGRHHLCLATDIRENLVSIRVHSLLQRRSTLA